MKYDEDEMEIKTMIKWGMLAAGVIFALVFIFSGTGTVTAGHRGVLLRFGAVQGTVLQEGFYFKIPLIDKVREIEVRVQKFEVSTEAASKDLQTISTIVALNFGIEPEKVANIYQKIGDEYINRVIVPTMNECIKSTTAQYTAEELITKRESVRQAIKVAVTTQLSPDHIKVQELNIIDFDFSHSFNAAIEAKVTAEQSALAAKNKLAQVEYEAQQKVAESKGKAEAMKIEAESLRSCPEILQLRALEKWNGILPQATGNGAMPFITLKHTGTKE
jgi:regulator of protease activity HflC (stomatin/prohibitin superfamily)